MIIIAYCYVTADVTVYSVWPACFLSSLPRDSLPIDMLISAVSVLVVAQSSSEIPEGLMNNPVVILSFFLQSTSTCLRHICSQSSGGILYIYNNW